MKNKIFVINSWFVVVGCSSCCSSCCGCCCCCCCCSCCCCCCWCCCCCCCCCSCCCCCCCAFSVYFVAWVLLRFKWEEVDVDDVCRYIDIKWHNVCSSVVVWLWVTVCCVIFCFRLHASVRVHKNTALESHRSDHHSHVHKTAHLKQKLSESKQENTME